MTKLEIILSAILLISIALNVGLVLYTRVAIVQLLTVSSELGDMKEMSASFTNHLRSVYELETFYGDETLHGLLEHATSFSEQLETFEYIYSLTEEGPDEAETEDLEDAEYENETETQEA